MNEQQRYAFERDLNYVLQEIDVPLDMICYPVMQFKGFWDDVVDGPSADNHIARQLLHLFLEIEEWDASKEAEELADVLIVMADMCGFEETHIPMWWVTSAPHFGEDMHSAARRIGQSFRKTNLIDEADWFRMAEAIGREAVKCGIDIREAFVAKMRKNLEREQRYGTPTSGTGVLDAGGSLDDKGPDAAPLSAPPGG